MPSIGYAVAHAFLSIIIISANIMVIVVLCQLKKKKPSRNYVFILNLAAADLLVGVMCIGEVLDDATDVLFDTNIRLCLLRFCMSITPSIGSILTLLLVSLDRYLAVKLPLHYPTLMSRKSIIFSLAVLWTVSFLVGHMPLVFSQLQQSNFTGTCSLLSAARSDYLYIICFGVFVPALLTLIGLHISVGRIAYQQHKQIQRTCLNSDTSTTHLRHFKALRTVFMVIICFILFWGPYYVAAIVKATCASCSLSSQLKNFLYLLGETNSLINPFIYSLYNKDIRTQFTRLMCKGKGQISPRKSNELAVAHINVRIQSDLTGRESMQQKSSGEQDTNTILLNVSSVCGTIFPVS